MSSEWNRSYEERINWVNGSGGNTPLDEKNMNKMDKALQEIDGKLMSTGAPHEHRVPSNNWYYTSSGTYPYYQTISTSIYKDDSVPVAILSTPGKEETAAEHESLSYVKKVWFDSNGITLYATNRPTANLKLLVRGY